MKSKQQHPLPFPLLHSEHPMQPVPSPFSIESMQSLPLFNKENNNQHLPVRRNLSKPPANLRIDTKSSHTTSKKANQKRKHRKQTKRKLPIQKNADGTVPAISHPTRIIPTNLNIKELLQLHQFTPSGGSSSQLSPMKNQFDSFNLNESNDDRLKSERDEYLKKKILTKPTKPVSGYQIFAKWVRENARDQCSKNVPQTTAISQLWKKLTQSEKEKWDQKTEIFKKEYQSSMKQYKQYVSDAKRLGLSVPQKTTKSELQPCKIKNLLSLMPDLLKYDKESQFLISKAAEMFIQYYGSKAITIANQTRQCSEFICATDCFDALNTEHKFNFLRAVTVPKQQSHPKNHNKRGVKRQLDQIKTESSSNADHISISSSSATSSLPNRDNETTHNHNNNANNHNKKRKLNHNNNNQNNTNNNNNSTVAAYRHPPAPFGMAAMPNSYDYYPNPYNGYNKQMPMQAQPQMQLQPQLHPHPFHARATLSGHVNNINPRMYHPFYAPQMQMMHPNMYNPMNNHNIAPRVPNAPKSTSQIVNVQQIFGGSDD